MLITIWRLAMLQERLSLSMNSINFIIFIVDDFQHFARAKNGLGTVSFLLEGRRSDTSTIPT